MRYLAQLASRAVRPVSALKPPRRVDRAAIATEVEAPAPVTRRIADTEPATRVPHTRRIDPVDPVDPPTIATKIAPTAHPPDVPVTPPLSVRAREEAPPAAPARPLRPPADHVFAAPRMPRTPPVPNTEAAIAAPRPDPLFVALAAAVRWTASDDSPRATPQVPDPVAQPTPASLRPVAARATPEPDPVTAPEPVIVERLVPPRERPPGPRERLPATRPAHERNVPQQPAIHIGTIDVKLTPPVPAVEPPVQPERPRVATQPQPAGEPLALRSTSTIGFRQS